MVHRGLSGTEKGKFFYMAGVSSWAFFVSVTLLWKAGYGPLLVWRLCILIRSFSLMMIKTWLVHYLNLSHGLLSSSTHQRFFFFWITFQIGRFSFTPFIINKELSLLQKVLSRRISFNHILLWAVHLCLGTYFVKSLLLIFYHPSWLKLILVKTWFWSSPQWSLLLFTKIKIKIRQPHHIFTTNYF